ncbi:MAG: lamin tail domain-containing protein [Thermoleophilia bacterium]|nr:lamin tail domain-containing protein [Thermoleophilia bacterium]
MSRVRLVLIVVVVLLAPSAVAPAPAVASASGVVISEFRFRGPAGASDEFVELTNAGAAPVDVSGWRVQACSATTGAAATRATVPDGTTLAPGRHLLVAHTSGYTGAVPADLGYGTGIADGGGVRLVTPDGTFVDGAASVAAPTSQCREGTGLTLPTTDSDTSFERLGGMQDTDDNATDFAPATSDPQNLASTPPEASIEDVVTGEEGEAHFTVALSAPSGRTITIGVATEDGTATAPADYTAVTATVELAPGERTATVAVPIAADELDEPDETFSVVLTAAARATIGDGVAEGTIVDDDLQPALSVTGTTVVEGDAATFAITLSAPSAFTVSVAYASVDGTATAPADYEAAAGTLVISPGETSATVSLATVPDAVDEPNEQFALELSDPVHASLAVERALATIVDDDDPSGGPAGSTPGSLLAAGRVDGHGVLVACVRFADGDGPPRGHVLYLERGVHLASTSLTSLVLTADSATVTGTARVGGAEATFALRLEGRTVTLRWGERVVAGALRGALRTETG